MNRDAERPLGHQEAWELIPWYVNGTLERGEEAPFEAHLARCPVCRREVEVNLELAVAVREAGELPSPEPGLARVLERLDHTPLDEIPDPAPRHGPGRLLPAWWDLTPRPARRSLAAGLAAVVVLAVALGTLLLSPGPPASPEAGFRTLSTPAPATAGAVAADGHRVRLVFAPSTTEPELRRLLLSDGGRLAGGPSPAGVYTAVYPESSDLEAVLERLRAAPRVELAEPVSLGGEVR